MTMWLAVAREQNAVQAVHRDVFTVRDDAAVKTLVYCVYVCVSDTGCQQAVGGFLGVIAQIRQRNYSALSVCGPQRKISIISLNQPAQINNSHFSFAFVSSPPPSRAGDMTSTIKSDLWP